jgi:IMP and pyridine-specific 5'-nucleotidase
MQTRRVYCCLRVANCLLIGDQFLHTGNDVAARGSCPCLWITKPSETKLVLEEILKVHTPPPQ